MKTNKQNGTQNRRICAIALIAIIAIAMATALIGCKGDDTTEHVHQWGAWTVTTAPTCTTTGEETKTCTLDATHKETRPIAALGHNYVDGICTVCHSIEMVYVSGGTFEIGKDLGTAATGDVTPVHTVTLTGFSMSKYQVTQDLYQAVMGTNPSNGSSDPASGEVQGKRPVEQVSWYDAIEFCNALSIQESLNPYYTIDKVNQDPNNTNEDDTLKWTITRNANANGYRLPTEAQWEYAAKGGNGSPGDYTYAGSNDADEVAWYSGNSGSKTHEVGKNLPNKLGIYDMSGNVYEWCWDWYGNYVDESQADPAGAAAGTSRVVRGGFWIVSAEFVRSVYRFNIIPNYRGSNGGFRLVRP